MTAMRSGRALDLCDVRQGGDVSPSLLCTAAPRQCSYDHRERRRADGWPKTQPAFIAPLSSVELRSLVRFVLASRDSTQQRPSNRTVRPGTHMAWSNLRTALSQTLPDAIEYPQPIA